MTAGAPAGWPTVTPRIVVEDVDGLVGFLRRAFDATGEIPANGPAAMTIGDSKVLVGAVGPREAFPAFLYVYTVDADAAHRRAIDAGAVSLEAPWDTPYGDRRAMVRDAWGNVWQIATHLVGVT